MTITKEGALTSFYTVNKAPIKHLRVYFSPKQAGSGTASPENVREIEGWNDINITQVGKNLFDINTMTNRPGVTISGNTFIGSAQDIRYYHDKRTESVPIFIPAGTTFIVHCTAYSEANVSTEGAGLNPWFEYKDGTTVRPWYTRNSATSPTYYSGVITATQDIVRYYWGWYNYAGNIWHISDLQFEISSVASKYEPCINSTHAIDWSNDIGTIYGGYVDLITGELYQGWRKIKVADLSWSNYSGKISYYASVTKGLTGSYRQQNTYIYSDTVPMRAVGAHLSADVGQITYFGESTTISSDKNNIWIMLPEAMEQVEARAWVAEQYPNACLCYKLETPILVGELNQTELQTFIGTNNIWSNANGNIEVKYWTH